MRNIMDQASETASNVASKASEVASNLGSRASDVGHQIRDRATEVGGQLRDQASHLGHAMGESPIARSTGRIPTDAFLIAAAGSIVSSLALKLMGRQKDADFVGHWAPTLISLGLLSKLVEHDRHLREHAEATPARRRRSSSNSGGEGI